jgi:hypothetical protein
VAPVGRPISDLVAREWEQVRNLAWDFVRAKALTALHPQADMEPTWDSHVEISPPGAREAHREEILARYEEAGGDRDAEDDRDGEMGPEARAELRQLLDLLRQYLEQQAKVVKGRGQPCKPGETTRGGCIPANRLGHAKPGAQTHGTQAHGTQGQGIVGTARTAYASARARLSSAGKVIYDRLPKPAQHAVDLGMSLHHRAEGLYRDGQALAKEVARLSCPRCSEASIARTARILSIADGVGRIVVSTAAESVAHAVGGLVLATVAGKTSWFLPAASMAFVAAKMVTHAARGRDPFALVRSARQAVRAAKTRTSRSGFIKPRRTVEHALGSLDESAVADVLRLFAGADDPDRVEALLAAALDESGMDLGAAVELATAALEDQGDEDQAKGGG